jgi:hypothetical protein
MGVKMKYRAIPLLLSLITLTALPVRALDREFGIDRSNLSTQSPQMQVNTLAGIHSLGAEWFRDGYTSNAKGGIDAFISELRLAKQNNLKILYNVLPVASDYDDKSLPENAGPEFKKRCGWSTGSRKLSQINLNAFSNRMRSQLGAIKAAGVNIDAFEVGNEFDWICFNGDVPDGHAATQEEFMTAVRAYAHFLMAATTVIHSPQYYPHAKIITFGLAHGNDNHDRPPHHFSNPASMIAQLRNVDGANYLDNSVYRVDGYGSHIYPPADSVGSATQEILRQDLSSLGNDKPIWVTEWGLNSKSFPNRRGQTRAQGMAEFYGTLGNLRATFGPTFYYAYDGGAGGSGLAEPDGNLLPDARAVHP